MVCKMCFHLILSITGGSQFYCKLQFAGWPQEDHTGTAFKLHKLIKLSSRGAAVQEGLAVTLRCSSRNWEALVIPHEAAALKVWLVISSLETLPRLKFSVDLSQTSTSRRWGSTTRGHKDKAPLLCEVICRERLGDWQRREKMKWARSGGRGAEV